jgi:hypothetical protein
MNETKDINHVKVNFFNLNTSYSISPGSLTESKSEASDWVGGNSFWPVRHFQSIGSSFILSELNRPMKS